MTAGLLSTAARCPNEGCDRPCALRVSPELAAWAALQPPKAVLQEVRCHRCSTLYAVRNVDLRALSTPESHSVSRRPGGFRRRLRNGVAVSRCAATPARGDCVE